jgi:hypothetical protein
LDNLEPVAPEDRPTSDADPDRSRRHVHVDEFERGVVVGELAERIRELETEEVIKAFFILFI